MRVGTPSTFVADRTRFGNGPSTDVESNVWRDTPLRYVGYADELGEAMAPYIGHQAVTGSYLLSGLYALGDVITSSHRVYHKHRDLSRQHRIRKTVTEALDSTLFHLAATVFIPALMIKYLRQGITRGMGHALVPPAIGRFRTPIATLAGVLAIPLISKPVDQAIDKVLDWTYRPLAGKNRIIGSIQSVPADLSPAAMNFRLSGPRQAPVVATIERPHTFNALFG